MQRKPLSTRQIVLISVGGGLAGLVGTAVHHVFFPDFTVLQYAAIAAAVGSAVGVTSGLLAKWFRFI